MKKKKTKQNLRELWNNIQQSNICVSYVLGGEEGEEEILKHLLEKRLFLKLQESEDQGKNFDEEVWKLFDYFVNKGFKREMVVTLGKAILNQFNQELGQK